MTAPVEVSSFPRRRPWLRPTLLAVGGLLTAVLLLWATTAVAATLARTSDRFTRTVRGEITAVEIDSQGFVDISPGEAGRARTEVTRRFGLSRPSFTHRLDDDGVLHVKSGCGDVAVWCQVNLRVRVPADVAVQVRASSVRAADLSGPVTVDTQAGDVELIGLSGDLRVNLGAGEVQGRDLTSERVRAGTGAGSLRLDFRDPPRDVEARTGAGEAVVLLPRGSATYDVDANAGAGDTDVAVRTDPGSPRMVRVTAGAGSARVDYGDG